MKFNTIEESFEYRMERVLGDVLKDLDLNPADMTPDELEKVLWDNTDAIGQRVYEDMFVWISADEWLKLLRGE